MVYTISAAVQYVQIKVKVNGIIVTMLLTPDAKIYVQLTGIAFLSTEIGSIAVIQVGVIMSIQGLNPGGIGPQSKFKVKLKEPD